MGLKDMLNDLRNYFVEDDEDFAENPNPAAKPKPTVVRTAPSTAAASEKSAAASAPRRDVRQSAAPKMQMRQPQQTQQTRSVPKRPYVAPKEKTLEKNSMNQTITAQQQQTQAAVSSIAIKEPRAYADIMEAARIVKNGESVLVNFKFMGDNQARRSIDFMTGVAFTLDGDIQNVGGQIFLMTPAHITVDAAKELSMLAGQNFESYDIY